MTAEEYVQKIKTGDRKTLAQAITLIESTDETKYNLGYEILVGLSKEATSGTLRIGITGTPGVGKSTFIENLTPILTNLQGKTAILAIDPSSQISQGSILGDKTRMAAVSNMPNVFIRPTPSSNILGGAAAHTYETIMLCEYAGYKNIIIETVGVGQSEVEVDKICDLNMLLLQPGAGDDLQGIKRGILEKADIIIVHKADGIQLSLSQTTQIQYSQSLKLLRHALPSWTVPVICVSSLESRGFDTVISSMDTFVAMSRKEGYYERKRKTQENYYTQKILLEEIQAKLIKIPKIKNFLSMDQNNNLPLPAKIYDAKSRLISLLEGLY
jgi:LAO/AO transport system kinase